MDQYCMYLRKSRADLEAEARGEGETLERHKRILFDLAKKLGIPVTQVYQEIVSGERIKERPVVQQLLNEVEDGRWTGVLVVEVERLARGDTIDQGVVAEAFKLSNTKIITPIKTYDPNNEFDEEYFEFGLFMSRREYKTINRRMQRGRVASVKEGNYIGNVPPYGYRRIRLDDGCFSLEPHPDQAPVVKMIFDMYVNQGIGTSLIARRLNESGIPTARHSLWTVSTVNNIIRNSIYAGYVRWHFRPTIRTKNGKSRPRLKRSEWTEAKGKHEALISEEIFERANQIMKTKCHPPAPAGKITNPLAGLIRCGICERAMVRRPYTNKPAHIICSNSMCSNKSSLFESVEDKMLQGLETWLKDYKAEYGRRKRPVDSSNRTQLLFYEKTLQNLKNELEELQKQKGNLYDLLERKIYSEEIFLERSQDIARRIAEKEAAIASTEQKIENEHKRIQAQTEIIPKVEKVLQLYRRSNDPKKKNELLKTVLDHAVYVKEKHQRLDNFSLTLYPKLPQ